MTEEHKDNLISKMLESPAALSDIEIMQILEDEELREIFDLSLEVKSAKGHKNELDPALEWEIFRPRIPRMKRWYHTWYGKTAAIFVGVLVISNILNIAINYVMDTAYIHLEEKTVLIELPTNQVNNHEGYLDYICQDEMKTDTIGVADIGKANIESHKAQKQAKQRKRYKQYEQSQPIDIDQYIRVQKARMENDFAVQQAEAIVNQYYAMADINDAMHSGLGDGYQMDDEILTLIIP